MSSLIFLGLCAPRLSIATGLLLPRRVLGLSSTFFERPLSRQTSNGAAHGSLGDLYATLIEESLAMLPQGQVGIRVQMLWQPLLQGLALHGRSAGNLHRLNVPRLTPSVEPALDGR